MARIAYDLDGTIVGKKGPFLFIRPGIIDAIKKLKRGGHTVILWTFGNLEWWHEVRQRFPQLRDLFHEVYTRNDLLHRVTWSPDTRIAVIKDIRKIKADVLIDNDPSHYQWARRNGMAKRYVLVPTIGD